MQSLSVLTMSALRSSFTDAPRTLGTKAPLPSWALERLPDALTTAAVLAWGICRMVRVASEGGVWSPLSSGSIGGSGSYLQPSPQYLCPGLILGCPAEGSGASVSWGGSGAVGWHCGDPDWRELLLIRSRGHMWAHTQAVQPMPTDSTPPAPTREGRGCVRPRV